jgi:Spy/CpxP family protein refolding chaperone
MREMVSSKTLGIREVTARHEARMKRIQAVDVNRMTEDEIPLDMAHELTPRDEPDNFDKGYLIGPRPEDHIMLSKRH